MSRSGKLQRRMFLRSVGVSVGLPALDAMVGRDSWGDDRPNAGDGRKRPKRVIFICTSLGLHGPSLFPKQTGKDYEATPYLKLLEGYREDFTIFSGLSHPDQAGADGHSSQMTWLSAAPHPGLGGFRNSISVDQLAREQLGQVTRFPSIELSTHGTTSQSYSSGGVMVPAEWRPSALFERLFLQGKPQEIERQRAQLKEGRSVLDGLMNQTKALARRVGEADRRRLEAYFDSLRQSERELQVAGEWLDKPKPKVDQSVPRDIQQDNDLIGRTQQLIDLIPLIVQTDSSRIISVVIQGRNDVPPIDGVSMDHHNLSHHGQDESKIEQLQRIETAIVRCFGGLLGALRSKDESGESLLSNTTVLFGSNLGNANSHDWRNLPILFAGGRFRHGQHIGYDPDRNVPLCNLFVTMLQKHMGFAVDRFASSTSTLDWA